MDPKGANLESHQEIKQGEGMEIVDEVCDPQNQEPKLQESQYPAVNTDVNAVRIEERAVLIPPNRMKALKKNWMELYKVIVGQLNLQVKIEAKKRLVKIRTCKKTTNPDALQKAEDFVRAFSLGFLLEDALALVRLNDIYMESFEIKDVRTLAGGNLSRAIGRIIGKDGKMKFAIENMSLTRLVVADHKIHIMGTFPNIRISRDAVVSLIQGATIGGVYAKLRTIHSRMKETY